MRYLIVLFAVLLAQPVYAGFWTGVAVGAAASNSSSNSSANGGLAVLSYDPTHVVYCYHENFDPVTNMCTRTGPEASVFDSTLSDREQKEDVAFSLKELGCAEVGLSDVKRIVMVVPPKNSTTYDYYLIVYDPEGAKC